MCVHQDLLSPWTELRIDSLQLIQILCFSLYRFVPSIKCRHIKSCLISLICNALESPKLFSILLHYIFSCPVQYFFSWLKVCSKYFFFSVYKLLLNSFFFIKRQWLIYYTQSLGTSTSFGNISAQKTLQLSKLITSHPSNTFLNQGHSKFPKKLPDFLPTLLHLRTPMNIV